MARIDPIDRPQPPEDLVVVGRITAVHGIKGWVKIHSFTEPEDNIVKYQPWWVSMPGGARKLEVDQHRSASKGLVVHLAGVDDRDDAKLYCQRDILVSPRQFPQAGSGDFYWYQLQGLRVVSRYGGLARDLGTVTGLLETGANDVMVVAGDERSLDGTERLIPYIDDVIEDVDLEGGAIYVSWDPDFDRG